MTTAGKDNLTRAEAQQRGRLISGVGYDVALNLRVGEVTFTSDTTVRFSCSDPRQETFIDLDAVEVTEVELNGRILDVRGTPDGRIALSGLEESNELRISAVCAYSRTGTGLHRTVDPVDKRSYTYTQFEPFDAHRVFACFDQPDLKATFTFDIEVPDEWVVISNTRPRSRPEEGREGRWVFGPTPVMSTYLAAICAGPYVGRLDRLARPSGDIELGWWVRRSLEQYLDEGELFEITKAGFDFFESMFDYPYMTQSNDNFFRPEYKFGAMENLGCVTYSERMVFRSKVTEAARERRAEVILHEMSHMWFGDLVTMRWWNDLWLNESFATYMAYLAKERATRFKNSWVSFASDEKTWAYRQDQLPTTHPIVADIPDVEATHLNFDGITYAKGASVLKQLVAWVGEEAFFAGLRNYFKTHQYGNTELGDFLGPLEAQSGRNLDTWSKEWLETSGVNTVRIVDGAIVQSAADAHPHLRSHRMAVGYFDITDGVLAHRGETELDVVGEWTPVADFAPADLVLPNHKDLAYCKIAFDDRSLETLATHLRVLSDPLARTLSWNAQWEMVRDGDLAARRYIDVVLNNISGESDIGVVQDLVGRTFAAVQVYGAPSNLDASMRKVAEATRALLDASDAGSDFQLAYARAFIAAATEPDNVAFVRGLLDGATVVEGLEIDTDLRWHIVASLASAGEADDTLVATELERDPTDEGERNAAAARASRPDAAAKADAWEHATQDAEITLAMLRALAAGFNRPDQAALLAPYAQRYFADVLPFWERRELDLGLAFTGGFFPKLYTQAVLDAAESLLRSDPPPPVRRLLLEQSSESARVMRARVVDGTA